MCGFNKKWGEDAIDSRLLLNVSLPKEEILWYIIGFIGEISSLSRKLSFHMTILIKALSCQPLDFIRNFIWKVCLSWVCTVHHHFKMSCRWKSFKLSCMEKKNKSQKRFYFCRVIGRSIKTWLIFTITCSTWLAVCWEMLRGINSGERDKVESLIDPHS